VAALQSPRGPQRTGSGHYSGMSRRVRALVAALLAVIGLALATLVANVR
jgi:hypothetical protein